MIYIGAWHKTGTNAIKVLFRKYREKADLDFKFKSKLDKNLNYFIIENADNIKFIKLEQFMTASGREEIIDIIISHIPTLDKQLLSECITVHGKKKFNSTNPHFNYTYQDYFTDALYKEFDNLFPDDLFDVLGYLRK